MQGAEPGDRVESDVSDESAVERIFMEERAELGPVDFLVNNDGIQIDFALCSPAD